MPLTLCSSTKSLIGVLMLFLSLSASALADPGGAGSLDPLDAKHCVQLGRDEKAKAQTLTNTCSEKIEIAWCHTGSNEKGTHIGVCGESKYFRQHKTLAMGESVKSRATLPLDARIHFGACIGNYYSIMTDGNTGHYSCRPPKAAKTEAEKHEPAFPKSIFKGMVELRDTAAEKWKLELEKQCHDNKESAACTELKLTYENKKDPVASSGVRD